VGPFFACNYRLLFSCAPQDERRYGAAWFSIWGAETIIAWLTRDALIARCVIIGAIDGAPFETCIENHLAQDVEPGTGVLLDNFAKSNSQAPARALRKQIC